MIRFNKYQKGQYLNTLDRSYIEELENIEDTEENRIAFFERRKRTQFKKRNGILRGKRETSPLNENYATLAWAITNFRIPSKHSVEEKKEFLRKYLGTGFMEHEVLLNEYQQSMDDVNFKWSEFLKINEAIGCRKDLSDMEAKAYAQSLLSDVLDEVPEIIKKVEFPLP